MSVKSNAKKSGLAANSQLNKKITVKAISLKNPDGLIGRAYAWAEKYHRGQKRLSGEPYFNHAVRTAQNLLDWKLDEITIAAGLIHDIAEDTSCDLECIKKEFGGEMAFIVDGITKLGKIKYRGIEARKENIKKLILALSQDLRVILIKLADRLDNMQTLDYLSSSKQKRVALETYEIYSPLAYRLGMHRLSGELEDLAFPYLYPAEHKWLIKNIQERYDERENYLKQIQPLVADALSKAKIKPLHIDFRAKRYASLYKKLLRYDMDIERIYDLVAFRIIVNTIADCYAALGIIHQLWPPLPGRIKDYIAMPKPNGYRSLHTTVFCVNKKIVEFQVRTEEMHQEAEHGIAAAWAYQESKAGKKYRAKKSTAVSQKEIHWVKRLRAWQEESPDADNFIDLLKIDFFKDRIFAVTPKGEVIDLPAGATPIDFAYQIHSDVGNQCVGAKVNNRIVPLDYELKSSDVVEIIIQKGKKPSSSWLEFVKTSQAKSHIKKILKEKASRISGRSKQTEIKIIAENKTNLLKSVLSIFSRLHLNVTKINSSQDGRKQFQIIKIRCEENNQDKISKLIIKLKTLKEIKEIDYRFVE